VRNIKGISNFVGTKKFNNTNLIMVIIMMATFSYLFFGIISRADNGGEQERLYDSNGPKVYGVENGGIYKDSVKISFENGFCYLDGRKIVTGTSVDTEGEHKLEVFNTKGILAFKYTFVIDKTKPVISGVKDGYSYNNEVQLSYNEGRATLNGVNILNGYKVSTEGKYSIVVTDNANNESKVNFEIDKTPPTIEGVENLKEYSEPVVIYFNEGIGKLNETDFKSGSKVFENGEYLLKVIDPAGNISTVRFVLKEMSLEKILKKIKAEARNVENYITYKDALEKYNKLKKINVFVNGALVDFKLYDNVEPLILKDEIMVSVEALADYLGIRFYIDEETGEYVMKDADVKVKLKVDYNHGNVNINYDENLEISVVKSKGQILFPLKIMAKIFSSKLHWVAGATKDSGVVGIYRDMDLSGLNLPIKKDNKDNPNYPVITGVKNNGVYNKPVYVVIKSGSYTLDGNTNTSNISKNLFATLDGRKFSGGIVMEEGVHTISAESEEDLKNVVTFTIDKTPPTIKGVEDKKTYNKPVKISFDDGIAVLNGKNIKSETIISKNGNYQLVVTDNTGNSSSIDFVIELLIEEANINEGNEENYADFDYFNKDIEINANEKIKALYINDKDARGRIKISKEGVYTIKTVYKDGSEKINKIVLDKTPPKIIGIMKNKTYNNDRKIEFTEGKGSINRKELNSGDWVTSDGKYDVEVVDKAGNKTEITFWIDKTPPIISGVVDNYVYTDRVKVTFNEGIGRCNDTPILSGKEFKEPGQYKILVKDYAGNFSSVQFKIADLTMEEILEKIKENPAEDMNYSQVAIEMKKRNYKGIKTFVNGVLVDYEKYNNIQPIIIQNRTLVPIRAIVENLNTKIDWDDHTKTVHIKAGEKAIKMSINSNIVYLDETPIKIDVPVMNINNRVLVPLRFISQMLDKYVYWLDYTDDLRFISIY
jgi:hypothetical protein